MPAAPACDPATIAHPFPVDPTGGCTPAELVAMTPPPAPAGFAAFWEGTRAATLAVDPDPARGPAEALPGGWRRSPVAFTTLGGLRCGGLLLEPPGAPSGGLVEGHGYGGPDPDPRPTAGDPPLARLLVHAPGFGRSARAGLPDAADRHVVHGIADRDTYLIRACVAALWSATRALAALVPAVDGRLGYSGESFGGGLGALALPWEPAWRCARLVVPTFGHHPRRLRTPCIGSGEAVRRQVAARPADAATLAWYDAASAGTFVRVPVVAAPAYADPAVPAAGQWAIANAIPGARIDPLTTGHFDGPWSPAEAARIAAAWRALLADCGLLPG